MRSIMKTLVLTLLLGVALFVPAAAKEDDRLATIHLPEGFVIEAFAKVPNARQMAWGEKGTLFVGTRREGRVFAVTDEDGDGRGERVREVASGLRMPSGVAFRDGALYVAAVSTILRFDDIEARLDDPPAPAVVTDRLPSEGHHGWKVLEFGPDGLLYLPVGAPCDVCRTEGVHGNILRMHPDGSGMEIEGHILPRLGARRVPDVQRVDVASLHHEMRATPTTANRMLATLSRMFAVAELWQMRPDGSNPCRNIKHFREKRRERFLSDEEYRRLGEVLREVEREGSVRPSAIAAIRLLMLTGCRKAEVLTLRWEYVDLDRSELRLPDSKTGAKIVHLGDPAIAVLRGLVREDGNPWVITSPGPGKPLSDVYDQWHSIRCRARIKDVRLHDLRHSCAS